MKFMITTTGEVYSDRKECKSQIGHRAYNRHLKNGEISFYNPTLDKYMTKDEFREYMSKEGKDYKNSNNN